MAYVRDNFSRFFLVVFSVLVTGVPAWADWPPIAPEDLKMTDLAEMKGAPAVILLREEISDDPNNYHSVYLRIKILTEAGRHHADVEIPYARQGIRIESGSDRYVYRGSRIDSISARTVHADGTIVPFDGKVIDKMALRKRRGRVDEYRLYVKAFTLPDVQVGSIIDYRYSIRYDDHTFSAPEWVIQQDLFQKKATFKFVPYDGDVHMEHNRLGHGAAWSAFLPKGPQPQLHQVPLPSMNVVHRSGEYVDFSIENVPPVAEEPFMPPAGMLHYRVQFYYTVDADPKAFWKEEGKYWSKDVEKFLDRKDGIADAVAKAVLPADSTEQKVRKIYAFVTGLENQSYRPKRTQQEERALGLKNEGAEDALRQRSGDHDDLNRLFVAMVRAAGVPAWMMWVSSREENFFQPELLSTRQLDGEIAIVEIGGKDVFLDPGTKYCAYGLLDWRYSGSGGLRQTARKDTEFAESPLTEYGQAQILRLARVQLGADGKAEGTIKVGFYGLEAMDRRQKASATDDEGRRELLEHEVRSWLPSGSGVTLAGIPNWNETEPHLATEFKISVSLATAAGKRWLIPVHLFQVNEKSVFPSAERVNPIYLWYPTRQIDEVHIALPQSLTVESLPANDNVKLDYAVYSTTQKQESANSVVARRDLVMAGVTFPVTAYGELKNFYDRAKIGDDQQMVVTESTHAEIK